MNQVRLVFAGKPVSLIQAAQQAGDAVEKMGDRAVSASDRMAERFDYASSQSSMLSGGIGDIGGALTEAFGDDTAIGQFGAKMESASAIVTGFTGVADLAIFATNNLKLATIAQSIATARATIATKAATVAQKAMNLAMRMNPIGLIITAVVALVAIIVVIERRTHIFSRAWTAAWSGIQKAASAAWGFISKIPGWTGRAFSSVARAISAPYRAAFNLIARAWNATVGGLQFTIPGWVPGIGGNSFGVPNMPQFHAGGTVPGIRGTPTVALLQAGERVTSIAGAARGGSDIVIRGDGSRIGTVLVDLIADAVRGRGGRPAVLGLRGVVVTAHNVFPQVFYGGAYNGVTADVMTGDKIISERGYAEEGTIKASVIQWTFDDPTDKWRPTNPGSLVYDGKGGRNVVVVYAAGAAVRNLCEVTRWEPDQTVDFVASPLRGRRWVSMNAESTLRRIGQWRDPIRSAMYRHRSNYTNLLGYWPLEDDATSTRLTNTVSSGRPGTVTNATLAGIDGPSGSERVVVTAQESSLAGRFQSSNVSGWQLSWAFRLAAIPGVAADNAVMFWTTSNGYRWQVWVNNLSYRLQVLDAAGTVLTNTFTSFGANGAPNQWLTMRAKCSVSAGTVTIDLAWYPQYGTSIYSTAPTFSGTTGSLVDWQQPGNSFVVGAGFGHVYGISGTADNLLASAPLRSFDGYNGELAGYRFARLMGESGIFYELRGDGDKTQAMGIQRPDTIMGLIEELERTEGGLVFDEFDARQVVFRTRDSRYNTTPTMALTYPADVAPPLKEVIDDQLTANNVTVRNRDGGESTSKRMTGPMSIASVGDYPKVVDVNISDGTDIDLIADWELARGTIEGARYPVIVVDLDMNFGLLSQVNATDIGDRITVTGREPEPLDLYVIGIQEETETHRRKVSYICRPNAVFAVGIYDDAGSRYDSATTTLAAGATTTAASLSLTTANRLDCWSTTSLPYACIVAGEAVTVTAMTAPAGTGPYTQTATVTRSVNGVVKAQVSGSQFQLRNPVRYAR